MSTRSSRYPGAERRIMELLRRKGSGIYTSSQLADEIGYIRTTVSHAITTLAADPSMGLTGEGNGIYRYEKDRDAMKPAGLAQRPGGLKGSTKGAGQPSAHARPRKKPNRHLFHQVYVFMREHAGSVLTATEVAVEMGENSGSVHECLRRWAEDYPEIGIRRYGKTSYRYGGEHPHEVEEEKVDRDYAKVPEHQVPTEQELRDREAGAAMLAAERAAARTPAAVDGDQVSYPRIDPRQLPPGEPVLPFVTVPAEPAPLPPSAAQVLGGEELLLLQKVTDGPDGSLVYQDPEDKALYLVRKLS